MINFVWKPGDKLLAGTGGTENYTIGQVRELIRRGISAQIVTIGLGADDGRNEFIDIPFMSLEFETEIAKLEGVVVFVNGASVTKTKQSAYIFMHIPPIRQVGWTDWNDITETFQGRQLITPSHFAAGLWANFLQIDRTTVNIAYPFAESCFAIVDRKPHDSSSTRVLFAGRLNSQKGIYTFMEALHNQVLAENQSVTYTVTTAGSELPEGKIIELLVHAHPNLTVAPARKSPIAMANLMAKQDIIVMPSNSQYWHETFGIVSIEAQHSGCWVVASDDGGLPETDCGGVILVKPDDAGALANGINQAIQNGPLPLKTRQKAANLFTVEQSVDNLLKVLFPEEELVVRPIEKIVLKSSIKNI